MGKYEKGSQTEKLEFPEKRKLEELENLVKVKDMDFIVRDFAWFGFNLFKGNSQKL